MGMFAMRKPRGFHHSYIYVDERKEKLAKMEEDAKRELGMLPEKEFSPEDIRGKFIEGTTHLKRRKESGRRPVHLGVILVVVALLIYLWYAITNKSRLYTFSPVSSINSKFLRLPEVRFNSCTPFLIELI